jgi:hypothetical protein
MAYNYDRRTARERRHKQRGKAKRLSKRRYRQKRQQIKNKSRRWRKLNKAKVKRYQKRRSKNPQLYKMLPAKRASIDEALVEHGLFSPEEDIYLLENEIEFLDPSEDTPDVGFVNWIDLDETEVHAIFVREDGSRFQKTYDLYDFMDVATLMFEDDEEVLLAALDELHADAEEGDEEDDD